MYDLVLCQSVSSPRAGHRLNQADTWLIFQAQSNAGHIQYARKLSSASHRSDKSSYPLCWEPCKMCFCRSRAQSQPLLPGFPFIHNSPPPHTGRAESVKVSIGWRKYLKASIYPSACVELQQGTTLMSPALFLEWTCTLRHPPDPIHRVLCT